jgi:hypothetical protein
LQDEQGGQRHLLFMGDPAACSRSGDLQIILPGRKSGRLVTIQKVGQRSTD